MANNDNNKKSELEKGLEWISREAKSAAKSEISSEIRNDVRKGIRSVIKSIKGEKK